MHSRDVTTGKIKLRPLRWWANFVKNLLIRKRNTMHKKDLKFASVVEFAKLKFTHLYHSTKIDKAGLEYGVWLEHPPFQINPK